MASMKFFYRKCINNRKVVQDENFHNNLASFLSRMLSNDFSLFTDDISKELHQPSDYSRPSANEKEAVYRLIFTLISQNKLSEAGHCLIHVIKNYYPNYCYIWRIGFLILRAIGTEEHLNQFFKSMMKVKFIDRNNMIFEYMMHLQCLGDFEGVLNLYEKGLKKQKIKCNYLRAVGPERQLLPSLIRLTVAVSCYCLCKKAISENDDTNAKKLAVRAEVYFRPLVALIEAGETVDNYIVTYVDLLATKCKYRKAYEILKLYRDKSTNNFNAIALLLKFMIEYKEKLTNITDKDISDLRLTYITKMYPIDPDGDTFTVTMMKECADELLRDEEYEWLLELMFELVHIRKWKDYKWPWKRLIRCVKNLGLDSEVVQREWTPIKEYMPMLYPDCKLAQKLFSMLE